MAIKWTRPAAGFSLMYVKGGYRYAITQDVFTLDYYVARRPNNIYLKTVYPSFRELYIGLFGQELAGEDQSEETYKIFIKVGSVEIYGMDNYRIYTDEFHHKYAIDMRERSVKRFDEWERISSYFEYEADVKEWADKYLSEV